MGDLYGFTEQKIAAPSTADKVLLKWEGEIYGALQVQITYQQQVNRRRTIGGQNTLVWGSSPNGQITIQKLITRDGKLFNKDGWNTCKLGTISIDFKGCEDAYGVEAHGCLVSNFTASAEAEGLLCMENVVIDCVEVVTK